MYIIQLVRKLSMHVRSYDFLKEHSLFASKIRHSLENMIFPKKVCYLLRKYNSPFENTSVSEKVNYLLRKYDLFVE